MFYIRAYTFMYVCDTSCTYTIRSAPYVVRILHVFASIIENIRAYTADRMLIYTYAHTCIYVLSGSLMGAGAHTLGPGPEPDPTRGRSRISGYQRDAGAGRES